MPLLYFWRRDNYLRDLDEGVAYHLNQASATLHAIEPGDSLWAFTRNPRGDYVLAAELVIRAKTHNLPGYKYGNYRVWGDLLRSKYFATTDQPSAEAFLRSLSPAPTSKYLGQSFQGPAAIRRLTLEDHQRLVAYTQGLSLEGRAQLLPETLIESALDNADERVLEEVLEGTPAGVSPDRRKVLRHLPRRNRQLVQQLQREYQGRCQVCAWDPQTQFGVSLSQGHHIQWLSRGGTDDAQNLMLLCPNHHAAVHSLDAVLDYAKMSLIYPGGRMELVLNRHLGVGE